MLLSDLTTMAGLRVVLYFILLTCVAARERLMAVTRRLQRLSST